MATKNLVPRATGEGQLGTTNKKWGHVYAEQGNFNQLKTASGDALFVSENLQTLTITQNEQKQYVFAAQSGGASVEGAPADRLVVADGSNGLVGSSWEISNNNLLLILFTLKLEITYIKHYTG